MNSMDDAGVEPTVMPLSLLREITNCFSEDRKLGSGSFGKVYEGVYQDGGKIAVKLLYDMPGLDDKQFQNEFKHLARLRHKNIVRLLGYCHDIQQVQVLYEGKLILAEKTHRALCLEYMSNGSLQKFLSDKCDRYDWHTCYRIIKGICHGLKYLHNELQPPIYHLDLKPDNVLLDENMVPRIADFGISRLFSDEQTWATRTSLGTIGYSPPEFLRSNLVSNKFDIFSLGVVILKMMAGRAGYFSITDMSHQEFTNVVQENWTNRLLETSNRRNAYSEQVRECIQIGLSCVQEDRHKRPTIQDIVYRLEESEIKCTVAARKDWPLIFQEAKMHKTTTTLPGIDGFKISGYSIPGSTLKACGVPTNGTTHYKFQWVRCLEHGNTQPIQGATTYDYMVTADDLGTLLAVDCTPLDKDLRKGDLVRVFADTESKTTYDEGTPPLSEQQPTALERYVEFGHARTKVYARTSIMPEPKFMQGHQQNFAERNVHETHDEQSTSGGHSKQCTFKRLGSIRLAPNNEDVPFDISVFLDSGSEQYCINEDDITGSVILHCPTTAEDEISGSVQMKQACVTIGQEAYDIPFANSDASVPLFDASLHTLSALADVPFYSRHRRH